MKLTELSDTRKEHNDQNGIEFHSNQAVLTWNEGYGRVRKESPTGGLTSHIRNLDSFASSVSIEDKILTLSTTQKRIGCSTKKSDKEQF